MKARIPIIGVMAIALAGSLSVGLDAAKGTETTEMSVVTIRFAKEPCETSASLQFYSIVLKNILESRWSPPKIQPHTKLEAEVAIDVLKSGQIRNLHIAVPSQLELFDRSVFNAIRLASPFPPTPPLSKLNELPLTIRFSSEVIPHAGFSPEDVERWRSQRLKEAEEAEEARCSMRRKEQEEIQWREEEQQRQKAATLAAKLAKEERRKELGHRKDIENNPQSYLPGKRFMCIGGKLDPICVGSDRNSSSEVGPVVTVQHFGPSTAIFGHYWRGLACRIYWADGAVKAIACE